MFKCRVSDDSFQITVKSRLFQVLFISRLVYLKSSVSCISSFTLPPRPTISLSRDVLRSARKKWQEWGRGAFSWYDNWGSGGDPSQLEINKTLSFQDTWNKRDLTVIPELVYHVLQCSFRYTDTLEGKTLLCSSQDVHRALTLLLPSPYSDLIILRLNYQHKNFI